jgi:hypothetical protein
VPEASVIRRVQALSGFIGRKASVGVLLSFDFNTGAQLQIQVEILIELSLLGGAGILGGGVKSVDIERNTIREGGLLEYN